MVRIDAHDGVHIIVICHLAIGILYQLCHARTEGSDHQNGAEGNHDQYDIVTKELGAPDVIQCQENGSVPFKDSRQQAGDPFHQCRDQEHGACIGSEETESCCYIDRGVIQEEDHDGESQKCRSDDRLYDPVAALLLCTVQDHVLYLQLSYRPYREVSRCHGEYDRGDHPDGHKCGVDTELVVDAVIRKRGGHPSDHKEKYLSDDTSCDTAQDSVEETLQKNDPFHLLLRSSLTHEGSDHGKPFGHDQLEHSVDDDAAYDHDDGHHGVKPDIQGTVHHHGCHMIDGFQIFIGFIKALYKIR